MSVSQPIPLTPGNINIPAPPFIYLAHLLCSPQAKTLLLTFFSPTNQMWLVAGGLATLQPWHFDAGAVDKEDTDICRFWGMLCYPSQGERCTPLLPSQGQPPRLTEEDVSCYGRRWCSLHKPASMLHSPAGLSRTVCWVSLCSNQLHWEVGSPPGTWLMHDDVHDWHNYSQRENI